MRHFLFSLVVVITISTNVFAYSGGSGTQTDPYKISNAADWQAFMATWTDWNKQFILISDVNLTGVAVTPVGTSSVRFTGVFNGNGHIIRNVAINKPSNDYIGLFGYVNGGSIYNLGLADVNIIGRSYVGGIAGRNSGTITNCYAAGYVKGSSYVGGLAGYNYSGTMTACYATGTVTSLNSTSYTGGLAGRNNSGTITSCYSTGFVSGLSTVGGLVGYTNVSTIQDCFWDIETSGQTKSAGGKGLTTTLMKTLYVFQGSDWNGKGWVINDGMDYPRLEWEGTGGIPIPTDSVPFLGSGTEIDPYQIWTASDFALLSWHRIILNKNITLMADIAVSGITIYPIGDKCMGAFTGKFNGNNHKISNVIINQPDTDYIGLFGTATNGQILNLGVEDVNIHGHNYVAGLVADNYENITSCYVTGSVRGISYVGGLIGKNTNGTITSCHAEVTENGSSYLGGLVGYNSGTSSLIVNSYSSGEVTGNNSSYIGGLAGLNEGTIKSSHYNGNVTGNVTVGGLLGYNYEGTIQFCYSSGNVTGTCSSAACDVGGLIGYNKDADISGCYSDSNVTGTGTSSYFSYAGGLVGYIYGNLSLVKNCYATGNVILTNSFSYGGGLAGYLESGSIMNCYAAGTVSGASNIGGFVGYEKYGDITFSFWNVEISCNTDSYGVKGLTTEQMKSLYVYQGAGWAGQGWVINDGMDYPHLDWEGTEGVVIPADSVSLLGSGTLADPYQIWTAEDFKVLGWHNIILNKYMILMADIDLTNIAIDPIGEVFSKFWGDFNGNNHIISNATINQSYLDYVGLFGYTGGGHIYNLGVKDVNIIGRNNVGGLVGLLCSNIAKCYTTGKVSGTSKVGGMMGYNGEYYGYNNIISCYSTANVSGTEYIGGFAGYSRNYITDCYSTGEVNGQSNTGGLTGYAYSASGMIKDCFWDVETSVQLTSGGGKGLTTELMKKMYVYQGAGWTDQGWVINDGVDYPRFEWEDTNGIPVPPDAVPYAGSGTSEDPYQIWTAEEFYLLSWHKIILDKHISLKSEIDASGLTIYPIGESDRVPFTGTFYGNGNIIKNILINLPGCRYVGLFGYNKGIIEGVNVEDVNISGDSCIGGVTGENYGDIVNCSVSGKVHGQVYIGGLVGYDHGGTITKCYSSCCISGQDDVGGLVGYFQGSAESCFSTGAVNGQKYVGGLVGYNLWGAIKYCFSTGKSIGSTYVGGLCGYKDMRYNYADIGNFWDTNSSGTTTSVMGTGKTTEQMQMKSTFTGAGWDFVNTWEICEWTNYPRLLWSIPAADLVCPDGVNFTDYAFFAGRWLDTNCAANNDCEGSDLDFSGVVDWKDLRIFSEQWLEGTVQ